MSRRVGAGSRYPGRRLQTEEDTLIVTPLKRPPGATYNLRGSAPKRYKRFGPSKKAMARYIKTCMYRSAQLKWFSISGTTPASTSGGLTLLNAMQQGTSQGTRIGNQVRFLELEATFTAQLKANSGVEETDVVRVVVFKDRQPNGANPTVLELLCVASPLSCFNPDNIGNQAQSRFQVMWNTTFDLKLQGGDAGSGVLVDSITKSRVLKLDFTSTYTGNAGTISDLEINSLYLFTIANTASSQVQYAMCLKWVDAL